MSEEEKRPYFKYPEKHSNEKHRSYIFNSNSQDTKKHTFYSRPFLLFFKTKEDMIKEEWERMSDEDKEPYDEMLEKEEEEQKRKEEERPKLTFNKMVDQDQKQSIFISSNPRSFYIFMNLKEKTFKEDWQKMTEEEKKPYEEMAEKEDKTKSLFRQKKNFF